MGASTRTTTTRISSLVLFLNTFLLLPSLLWSLVFLSPVLSLHVVLGSSCTAMCTAYYVHPNTTVDQVTCLDSDYNNTSVGQRFKDCISCEIQSQTFDHATSQTDLGWALFNIRYTLSWCIFGVPGFGDHSSISPCSDTCRNISDAVEKDILNPTASTTYDFCDQLSSPADLSLCSSCYSPIKTQFYLSNSCELKIPIPTPFPIIGSQIFTNIPLGNYSSSSSSSKSRSNSLSYREKLAIGIAIPSTLLLLALLVILLWYIRDYRRKRGSSISNQLPRFPSPPTKPLPQYKPLPPSPPRVKLDSHSPPYHPPGPPLTVFHPTPRLNSLSPSSPAPKPFQPPHQSRPHHEAATQFIITHHPIIHHHDPTTPTTRATTNLTTAGPPSSLFPSPQPQSDMRGPSRMPPSSRGLIMSEHGGGRGRKHRNTKKKIKGRKERVESKVLFV